ncbi:MAG TPA: hypothetical protein VGL62_10610, partial [Vicinamibacterales bacterium]
MNGMTTKVVRVVGTAAVMIVSTVAVSVRAVQVHPAGTDSVPRVLWRDPGAVSTLDLSWPDESRFPRPMPPFLFEKEETSGTTAKVRVKDARGVEWSVKLAGSRNDTAEAHADVAAGRLVWALGYFVEPCYFVDGGVIGGVGALQRAQRGLTPDGHFRGARFKQHPKSGEDLNQPWTFRRNPFVGTRELSGLMILMTMVNNWDLTPDNHAV